LNYLFVQKIMVEPEINSSHQPVLYQETLYALRPHSPGRYIDATLGAGGHAAGILEKSAPEGLLLGLDIDPQAIELASRRLAAYRERAILIRASYVTLLGQIGQIGWKQVNGILFDLGVSSMQIDTPERGFSFQSEGTLDMRFDPDNPTSAYTLVNRLPFDQLSDLIWRFGEERYARRIARAIVQERPIESTSQLAKVILKAVGRSGGRIHPATRTFQALRIAVNQELQAIEEALPQAVQALGPGGRLAVISFHSLEDRIVKQFFQRESKDCICPPEQPACTCGHKATVKLITRKPISASEAEIQSNPRSRSAHLRVVEKL
jgi:16S rRNA (cytosine1402-N4)-methyltransferase